MCVYLCRAVVYIVEIDRKTRHTTFGVRDEGVLSDTKFHLHSLLLYLLHISLFNKHTNKYEPEIKIKIKKKQKRNEHRIHEKRQTNQTQLARHKHYSDRKPIYCCTEY